MINFKPEQITFHTADSDSMCRFIAGLTGEQARECIAHELAHENRTGVLALLSSQVSAKLMVPMRTPMQAPHSMQLTAGINMMPAKSQAQILTALMLARAHVRCALDGGALADLRHELDTALTALGVS